MWISEFADKKSAYNEVHLYSKSNVFFFFVPFQCKLWYYKGNYSMFKKMVVQKRRELVKAYEAQEKRIKEMKSQGQSKKKAEAKQKDALSRKQQKNQVRK